MKQPLTTNTTPITAATTGAPDQCLSPVTVAGAVPPALARQFQTVPLPHLPEVARLPRPRERCPITGASRTWLIETDAALRAEERFLFRVRQRGKRRGAVFINVAKALAFLRRAEAEETANGGKA